jgi:nucleoside-diphosphate kinase
MAGNLTLALIKPHAVLEKKVGRIMADIEAAGFGIIGGKMLQLKREGAQEFYKEHEGKDFFERLISTSIVGPLWALILAKPNAVWEWREKMGATNSAEAAPGTIRHRFGSHSSIPRNAVHGSATDHEALKEINFFFANELSVLKELEKSEP